MDLLNSIAKAFHSQFDTTKALIDHIVDVALTERPWKQNPWPDLRPRRPFDYSGVPTGYIDYAARLPYPVIQQIGCAIEEGAALSNPSFLMLSMLWWLATQHADKETHEHLIEIQRKYDLGFPFDISRTQIENAQTWVPSVRNVELNDKRSPSALNEVLLIGLDAAADLKNFGCALGRLKADREHRIDLLDARLMDSEEGLLRLSSEIKSSANCLVAIDAPLGWPRPMGGALEQHLAGQSISGDANHFFRRLTDRRVKERTGKLPLDIGADRIARAAFKALHVLDQLAAASGKPVRMAWSPSDVEPGFLNVVEVYPAATLHVYGLPSSGYKKDDQHEQRKNIVDAVHRRLNGIHLLIDQQADMFDAALCLLAAEDFLAGRARAPDPMELPIAIKEGWIWVPDRNN